MPTAPTANANETFSFNFPAASGCPVPPPTTVPSNTDGSPCHHVDYVTRTPFPLSTSITIDYTITGDNPVWGFETETGNTAGAPPKITLMIERTGDETLSIMSYRWFAYIAPIALGHFHITVPLTFSGAR